MKITKSVIINKPAADVWKIIAHDFDKAHEWMGPITNSYAIGDGESKLGAPMEGRMCNLSKDPNGAKAKEIITQYDEAGRSLTFDISSVDVPAIVPIKKNRVQMSVIEQGANRTKVVWVANPQLKLFAYPFYPLLRMLIPVAFGKLLNGLKEFAERPATA